MLRLLASFIISCFCLPLQAQFQGLIINEFSQGNAGNQEYIELLVVGNRTCTDSTADLRGWIIDDQNGWYGITNSGPGHYRFANDPNWAAVPFGSLIVLYNAGDKNPSITAADDITDANLDQVYIVPIGNTVNFIEQNSIEPDNLSGPAYSYPSTGYGSTTAQWPFIIGLSNASDVISVVNPSNPATAYFSIGYSYVILPGFQTPTVQLGAVSAGMNAWLSGSGFSQAANWMLTAAVGNETPGAGNDAANDAWILSMRQPATIPAPMVVVNQPNCFSSTGSVVISTPSGAGYSYSIDGVDYSNTWGVFSGMAPGMYPVTAKNGNCISPPFDVIIQPQPSMPTAPVVTVTQPDCSNPTGTITITSPLGADLLYSIDGVNYVASNVFTNLAPALYGVSVQNSVGGCTSPATIVGVDAPPASSFVVTLNSESICPGETATLTASPSVPGTYTYAWTVPAGVIDPGNVASFTTTVAGNYSVQVTGPGCTVGAAAIVSHMIVPTVMANDETTCSNSALSLSAIPTGGAWIGPNITGNVFHPPGPGVYEVVYEILANGCIVRDTAVVTVIAEPQTPVLQLSQPDCNAGSGSITIVAPTGVGISYSIDGINYQTSPVFNTLPPGNYMVWAMEGGCVSQTTAEIQAAPGTPPQPDLDITQPTCTSPLGTIVVTAPAGMMYSIDGVNFTSSSTFSGLNPGMYTITVQSASGCLSQETAEITGAAAPFEVTLPGGGFCQGDSFNLIATVDSSGTFDYIWSVPGGVTDPGNVSQFATNIVGTYSVIATDANGCRDTATTTVQLHGVYVTIVDRTVCSNDTIHLEANPSLPPAYWSGTNVAGSAFDASGLAAGTYNVSYIDPSNTECPQGIRATVTVLPVPASPQITVIDHCDGTSTLTASGGDSLLWSTGDTATVITVSTAGIFTLVQIENGCVSEPDTAIATPGVTPAAPLVSVMQPTCSTPTGTITITSPAPAAGISFSIDGLDYSNVSGVFDDLVPNIYQISVNENGCVSAGTTVVIDTPPGAPASPVLDIVQPACTDTTGTITVQSPVGAGYSFSIDGQVYQSSPVFGSLVSGTYQVFVQDTLGCVSFATAVVDTAPGVPQAPMFDIIHPSCTNPNGTITVLSPIGAGYSYSLDGQVFQTSTLFNSLASGTYQIIVQDANGCTSSAATAIIDTAPGVPQAPTFDIIHPTCTNPNGTITVLSPIGTGYSYSLDGQVFQTSPLFNSLTSGTYQIIVQDANGCTSPAATAIIDTAPGVPQAPTFDIIHPTCTNPNGTITLLSPIGTGYSYSLDGQTFQSSPVFTSIAPGFYQVVVQNVSGCISPATTAVVDTAPGAPLAPVVDIIHPTCTNASGTITIQSPVGAGFSYSVDGQTFQSSPTFVSLTSGSYQVVVQDSNSCLSPATTTIIDTAPGTPAAPILDIVQPDCINPTGTITIQSPIGSGYSFSVDGQTFQTSPVFNSLAPGIYQINVQNSNGCISQSQPEQIQQATGSIHWYEQACIQQGQTYSFNGQTLSQTGNYSASYPLPSGCDSIVHLYLVVATTEQQTIEGCNSVVFNGVTYTSPTIVQDTIASVVSGCDSLIRITQINILQPVSGYQMVCLPAGQGMTFGGQWINTSGSYVDTFTASNGCDSIVRLDLMVEVEQRDTVSGCGQVNYMGTTYVSDTTIIQKITSVITGCDSLTTITRIMVHPKPQIVVAEENEVCSGESITLEANAPGAAIQWTGFPTGNQITVSPNNTTSYQVIATSAAGCKDTATATVRVSDFDIQLQASTTNAFVGATVSLQSYSDSTYQVVAWTPAHLFPSQQNFLQQFIFDSTTTVMVTAMSSSGCLDTASLTILPLPAGDLYIPNAFTPDGNGRNDVFRVLGGQLKDFELKIFNRWGQIVFQTSDRSRGWDGMFAGKPQPTGTYVYLVRATLPDGTKVVRKGTVTLVRE